MRTRPFCIAIMLSAAVVFTLLGAGGMLHPASAADTETTPSGDGAEAISETTSTNPSWVVVLADGTTVPAKSKPLSAFGSFRYVDLEGRTQVLKVSEVDIEATRSANAEVPPDPGAGTFSVGDGVGFRPSAAVPTDDGKPEDAAPRPKVVTVYSAAWCGYCTQLKGFLASQNIPASIIEVDLLAPADQQRALAAMRDLTGRTSFPTVVIDGEAMAGFSPSWIQATLAR